MLGVPIDLFLQVFPVAMIDGAPDGLINNNGGSL